MWSSPAVWLPKSGTVCAKSVTAAVHTTNVVRQITASTQPRGTKNVCDPKGYPPIKQKDATRLFRAGIRQRMVSCKLNDKDLPVFVWAVNEHNQVYEAKPGEDGWTYHGYRLYKDDRQFRPLLREWKIR